MVQRLWNFTCNALYKAVTLLLLWLLHFSLSHIRVQLQHRSDNPSYHVSMENRLMWSKDYTAFRWWYECKDFYPSVFDEYDVVMDKMIAVRCKLHAPKHRSGHIQALLDISKNKSITAPEIWKEAASCESITCQHSADAKCKLQTTNMQSKGTPSSLPIGDFLRSSALSISGTHDFRERLESLNGTVLHTGSQDLAKGDRECMVLHTTWPCDMLLPFFLFNSIELFDITSLPQIEISTKPEPKCRLFTKYVRPYWRRSQLLLLLYWPA